MTDGPRMNHDPWADRRFTSSGRTSEACDPPPRPTPFDELRASQLGGCLKEDWMVTCPDQSSHSCNYRHNGPWKLRAYSLEMLLLYPMCEACDVMLEVQPRDER